MAAGPWAQGAGRRAQGAGRRAQGAGRRAQGAGRSACEALGTQHCTMRSRSFSGQSGGTASMSGLSPRVMRVPMVTASESWGSPDGKRRESREGAGRGKGGARSRREPGGDTGGNQDAAFTDPESEALHARSAGAGAGARAARSGADSSSCARALLEGDLPAYDFEDDHGVRVHVHLRVRAQVLDGKGNGARRRSVALTQTTRTFIRMRASQHAQMPPCPPQLRTHPCLPAGHARARPLPGQSCTRCRGQHTPWPRLPVLPEPVLGMLELSLSVIGCQIKRAPARRHAVPQATLRACPVIRTRIDPDDPSRSAARPRTRNNLAPHSKRGAAFSSYSRPMKTCAHGRVASCNGTSTNR